MNRKGWILLQVIGALSILPYPIAGLIGGQLRAVGHQGAHQSNPRFRFIALLLLAAALFAGGQTGGKPTRRAYVMISGWGLYPALDNQADPASSTLRSALSAIALNHVSGIVYGTLGVEPRIRAKAGLNADFDPNAYNRALFKLAKDRKADLWLQLRYYDNWVAASGVYANLTAPRILSDASLEKAFVQSAVETVHAYVEAYPNTCTIILGEEETMYHSKGGGGMFWAGQQVWDQSAKISGGQYLQRSAALDQLFVNNFTGVNRLLIRRIKSDYPACRVGVHIGHAPLYQNIGSAPVYAVILQKLQPLKLDFTFYDLYEKVSKTDTDFLTKLTDRVKLLKGLGQSVYYLAQLHTTNSFGAGGGRAVSAHEIDQTLELAQQLGVEGFGYYTKNALPTVPQEDENPLDPNVTAQNMVWQSSPKRWEFGLSKLAAFLTTSEPRP